MSRYWGYYSKTKDESSEHWFNHGEERLIELYENKEALLKLAGLVYISIDIGGFGSEPLTWLSDHLGEEIWLESEYGERKPLPLILPQKTHSPE
jgi:hypothetical protein